MPVIPSVAGTYALLLESPSPFCVRVGQLGVLHGRIGYYLYVGSAQGPGGLAARVGRHLGSRRKSHWHIDALLERLPVREVWYLASDARLECRWAHAAKSMDGASIPCPGFGASDCRCAAHLLWLPRRPSIEAFETQLCRRHGEASPRLSRMRLPDAAPG